MVKNHRLIAIAALAWSSLAAQAQSLASLSGLPPAIVSCTADLSVTGQSEVVYQCGGNLDVRDGTLIAGLSLTLNAVGDVFVKDVNFDTQALVINGNTITIDGSLATLPGSGDITLNTPHGGIGQVIGSAVSTTGSEVTFYPPITIALPDDAIPEPATMALMALGLVGIAAASRRRA